LEQNGMVVCGGGGACVRACVRVLT